MVVVRVAVEKRSKLRNTGLIGKITPNLDNANVKRRPAHNSGVKNLTNFSRGTGPVVVGAFCFRT